MSNIARQTPTSRGNSPGHAASFEDRTATGLPRTPPRLGLRLPARIRTPARSFHRPHDTSLRSPREHLQKSLSRHQVLRSDPSPAVADGRHRRLGLHQRQLRAGLQGAEKVHLRPGPDGEHRLRLLANDLGAAPRARAHADESRGVLQDKVRQVLAGQDGDEEFRRHHRGARRRVPVLGLRRARAEDDAHRRAGHAKDRPVPLLGLEGFHGSRASSRHSAVRQAGQRGLLAGEGTDFGALQRGRRPDGNFGRAGFADAAIGRGRPGVDIQYRVRPETSEKFPRAVAQAVYLHLPSPHGNGPVRGYRDSGYTAEGGRRETSSEGERKGEMPDGGGV